MHPYLRNLCKSDLATRSKTSHLERCRMLVKACDTPLDVILKNPEESYHKVREKYADAMTLNCILGSVLSIIKYNQGEPAFRDDARIVTKWRAIKSTLSQKLHDQSLDGKKTQKEQKGWVDWQDVLNRQRDLGREEFGSDRHLLLSLYCLIPPARLDYNDVLIMHKEPAEELVRNYLVVHGPESMDVFLNNYKTAVKYGLYRKRLPVELCRIIHFSLQKVPRNYLITQKRDPSKPMSNKSSYQKYVSNTMKSIFNNKPVTVNILRHSFISSLDYNANTPRDLIGYAKDMHHSIEQQMFYRRYPAAASATSPPQPNLPGYQDDEPPNHTQPAQKPEMTPPRSKMSTTVGPRADPAPPVAISKSSQPRRFRAEKYIVL
jgi:hypothetical protein